MDNMDIDMLPKDLSQTLSNYAFFLESDWGWGNEYQVTEPFKCVEQE